MDISITVSNRELSPAVCNFFQYENQTVTLKFTLDSYKYGEVDLRNYKAYGVTSQNGMVDMTELVSTYDSANDKLVLTWQVQEYSLRQVGPITYQICFKENADDGENTAVFYSYKGIMINRGSIDGDNHITANYPTLLKQWLDKMNNMAELFDAGVVYMPYGQSIPAAERLSGRLYFQYTDTANTTGQFEDDKGNVLTDPNVMHLIGKETLSGTKINTSQWQAKCTFDSAKLPESNKFENNYVSIDANDELVGYGGMQYLTDGTLSNRLGVHRKVNGEDKFGAILVGLDKDGNPITEAPTPANGDNSTQIATTAFVKTALDEKGSGKHIGEVFYSQSSKATDNPGSFPLFTGETISNAADLYPDFYKWVTEHTELQCTPAEYESAILEFGECPKYSIANKATSKTVVKIQFPNLDYPIFTGQPDFKYIDNNGNEVETGGNPYASMVAYKNKELTEYVADQWTKVKWQVQTNGSYLVYTDIQGNDSTIAKLTTDSNWQHDSIDYNIDGTTYEVDGSLRLPKLSNYLKMANTSDGITQSGAGLPNITGRFACKANINATPSGAFVEVQSGGGSGDVIGTGAEVIDFNASLSNSIYGNSDTVTPVHTTLYPWVYAFSASVPASTAQAAEFQNALSGKADSNLGNIPSNYDYVIERYEDEEGNWYEVWKSGKLRQGGLASSSSTGIQDVTFLKPFAQKPHMTGCTISSDTGYATNQGAALLYSSVSLTTTGFSTYLAPAIKKYWTAEGQGA